MLAALEAYFCFCSQADASADQQTLAHTDYSSSLHALAMSLEALPTEAWETIAHFLTGPEVLPLVFVNRWAKALFSQDRIWEWRFSQPAIDRSRSNAASDVGHGAPQSQSALQRYLRALSLQFLGRHKDSELATRGSCAMIPSAYGPHSGPLLLPLSFATWFCLLDERSNSAGAADNTRRNTPSSDIDDSAEMHIGGILFGVQSCAFDSPRWADNHQQFAMVSSDRKLYCSILNTKPEIASNLELRRWYHLALSYDSESKTQHVYLDGQLVSSLTGPEHREWRYLNYAQVGTGCVTASVLHLPTPQSCGWYPFNGVIDDFRMWNRALSSEDVKALASGRETGELEAELVYSLWQAIATVPAQHTRRIGCSRPQERVFTVLPSEWTGSSDTK